jgi:hypothetical protein
LPCSKKLDILSAISGFVLEESLGRLVMDPSVFDCSFAFPLKSLMDARFSDCAILAMDSFRLKPEVSEDLREVETRALSFSTCFGARPDDRFDVVATAAEKGCGTVRKGFLEGGAARWSSRRSELANLASIC